MPKNPSPKSAEFPLWLALNRIVVRYRNALATRLQHLGIRRNFFLLVAIGEGKGKLTQQQLADLLETDKVTMVAILDYLAENGFINRTASADDRRKRLITLTPRAEKALPEIKKAIADMNRRTLSSLPKKLAGQLPEALGLMREELDKVLAESGLSESWHVFIPKKGKANGKRALS